MNFKDVKEDNGYLIFEQTIYLNDELYTTKHGIWNILDGELCLSYCTLNDINNPEICLNYDYDTNNWECYDSINFQSNYFDCIEDISLCEKNRVELLFSDIEQGICSKEILESNNQSSEEFTIITNEDIHMFSAHIQNIYFHYQNNSKE